MGMREDLRSAVDARDYSAIDALFAQGATADDAQDAADKHYEVDIKIFEILLCSAPAGIDLCRPIHCERGTRRDYPTFAMDIRYVLLKKILIDSLLTEDVCT